MLRSLTIACLALIMATPEGARADEFRAPPIKTAPVVSIQAYGRQNPGCAEWTNGCVVCVGGAAGHAQCSTPGIACTPAGLTCKRQARP